MKTASTNILFECREMINRKRIQGEGMYCTYKGKNIPFGPSKKSDIRGFSLQELSSVSEQLES